MSKEKFLITSEEIIRRRDELFEALSDESDRGVILVSASFLDDALETLLRVRFSIEKAKAKKVIDPLFDTFGPLSTFSAKIKVSYAIDLIGHWMFHDLEILRKLRNKLAHTSKALDFDSKDIYQLIQNLKGADLAVAANEKKEDNKDLKKKKTQEEQAKTKSRRNVEGRARLEMSVTFLGAALLMQSILYINSDKPMHVNKETIEKLRIP